MPPGRAWVKDQDLASFVEGYVQKSITKANRRAQYADLAGDDAREPYKRLKRDFRAARRVLKQALVTVKMIENHQHQWNADDRCDICGADGRA